MRRIWLLLALTSLISFTLLAQGSSFVTAVAIYPNVTASGTITEQSQQHYWKVKVAENGYLRFQIAAASTIDVNVILYDTDGVAIISTDYGSGLNSEVFGFVAPGTYYLRVYRWSGTSGTYTVSTSFTSPTRLGDPESNNTIGGAVPLSPTGSSTGHIGHFSIGQTDTNDYWRITTKEDGWLRVQVRADSLDARGDQALELHMVLYDFNGSTSLDTDSRAGTFSQVDHFVGPGIYYVRVYRWSGRAGSYDIKSEFFTPPLANDQDGNDSYQTASIVTVNGSATGHIGYYANSTTDNDDYWKFTTTSDGKVVVRVVSDSLDRSDSRFDLNLVAYDVNGTTSIATDNQSGNVSECSLHLRPGTYYVRIYRWVGNAASYTLSVTHTSPKRANDVEGNDWFASAGTLSLNVTATGHIGFFSNGSNDPYDLWRITATSSDSIYVHVTTDSTIDLNIIAYAPDTSTSLTSDYRDGIYSRVGLKPTSGSSYYIKVYQWTGTAGAYSIVATKSNVAVGVEKNEIEAQIPQELALEQNYPNPFNPATTIKYSLPERTDVRVSVYSLLGQEIALLVHATQDPSSYTVTWNGRDTKGTDMPSGIYIIRLQAGNKQFARKAVLVR
jgi:hypothetical protein